MRFFIFLCIFLSGCTPVREFPKLENEVLPGIVLRADEQFRAAHANMAAFDFSVELENTTETAIRVEQWTATIVSANQGNGVSSFSRVLAEPATVQPGGQHSLNGYLYIGPGLDSRHPERWISSAVGVSAARLPEMSSERKYGDCLIGLRMSLRTDRGNPRDLFLVKYHYDESLDRIRPYQILGVPIDPIERD